MLGIDVEAGQGRVNESDDIVAGVKVVGLTKRHGQQLAVRDISFEVPTGTFCTLLGASGCGKDNDAQDAIWTDRTAARSGSVTATSPAGMCSFPHRIERSVLYFRRTRCGRI